ncbi:serine/threonine protein kinase [Merismopedia glauca]|uniref:Serine/threonine protein kinase n=1 Tax=Merismopedia glauca CCAP 1448/3 TaxID=1296344 RepID=A0A2T1C892_9CYAN|nr:serine/threonine-protein kinase [Merismopedia glauca]PSB04464.1 serine/threonine protein kinase [Merismopedia glauca CCAP 1448/3]
MLGQVLGERYELKEYLSTNPGRKTFLARDLQTEELVIIKLLSFGLDFNWQDLKLFEREAETLKSLSHPAIPSYIDSFEVDLPHLKCFAITQTYISGISLDRYLKDGRVFTEQELKELAKSLLKILIYLHGNFPPVIHRDIKPSNILINNRSGNSLGDVYLVDFGSVQTLAARDGRSFTVTGSYGYMPPEQFGGRAVPASDLYALGGTLIYLITGIHPGDLPQKDLKLEFESLVKNLSYELVSWLQLMTEPSLDKRFSSAEAALQELEFPSRSQSSKPKASGLVTAPSSTQIILNQNKNALEIVIPGEKFAFNRNQIFGITLLSVIGSLVLGVNPLIVMVLIPSIGCLINTASLKIRDIFTIDNSAISWRNQKQISLNNRLQKIRNFFLRKSPGEKFRTEGKVNLLDKRANITHIYLLNCLEKYREHQTFYQIIQVCTKEKTFVLPALTIDEGSWLINELSSWLKLPIEVRSQTTKR